MERELYMSICDERFLLDKNNWLPFDAVVLRVDFSSDFVGECEGVFDGGFGIF